MIKMKKEILEFYQKTSSYTDLGAYQDFAKNLPDDIDQLCLLQRMQIIHPFAFRDKEIRNKKNCFWGDMTKVPITRLEYEDDIFPTAQSIIAELLRKDPGYHVKREAKNKVHVTCRGQAILLASILKAKGIPARVRSGFAEYILSNGIYYDHWITEYYDKSVDRWKLVEPDEHCPDHEINFALNDIPYNQFLFGAYAYLGIRQNQYQPENIFYSSEPPTLGLKASLRCLFFDFHSLMNHEIIFLHLPKYIQDKNFVLSEEEYQELDSLAHLMLDPDKNLNKLQEIWENTTKFRILSGALN